MLRSAPLKVLAAVSLLSTLACGQGAATGDEDVQDFTSDAATLMLFDFSGEFTTPTNANLTTQTKGQLFYLVGQLNAYSSVARLNRIKILTISSAYQGAGLYKVSYHLQLPVAWGSKTNLPTSFQLQLPRRVDTTGLSAFWSKYYDACGEHIGDEVTAGNFWYHYRPRQSGCSLAAADVVTTTATVSLNPQNTQGKYPELHRVWEDGVLRVVAVFGKYTAGATSDSDAGISAYNAFVAAVTDALPAPAITPTLSANPGAAHPDVTIEAMLADGRRVVVSALLVDEVKSAPPSFDKRYGELTPGADVIMYNGHAGLGSNIAALQNKGNFFPGQYQIMFFDGCDTFAYLDDTLATRRAALNPDDASGTKYLDVVTNAMPAYFSNMPDASLALIKGLLDPAHPKTYQSMFAGIAVDDVVVVTNEEDNVFTPGMAGPRWTGFTETGSVGKSESVLYTTPTLPPGKYVFSMVPLASQPGGDADLRARVGAKPDTTQTWKCKSYVANSDERCVLTVTASSQVYLTVTGDKVGVESAYELRGFSLQP